MTRKPRNSSQVIEGKTRFNDVQFINYDFDETTRAAFKKWVGEENPDALATIDKLVDSSYNISVKWDVYNECYSCFLTPVGDDHPHKGFILTGRGRSSEKAILGALYRHYVIFDGSWPIEGVQRNRATDDD